ncbi:MAG: rRNA pseudouridine synthase [Spirochaetaceae bacterium]|jgi:23S rRNA pseudouridine2605 synthase|nr:rRNA pseudouridine synthase [Spirochaetaceae bacterium]
MKKRAIGLNSTDKVETALPEGEQVLRLQVYLAHAGVASRRASEKLIAEGRVSVNGRIVSTPGEKVSPEAQVCLDGVLLRPERAFHYLALHKPPLYICSSADPQGRPLAQELLPGNIRERLYHVGRLDFRSSGLILFTNDGGFAAKISHPSAEIEKEYLVEASGPIPDKMLEDFVRGVIIDQVFYQSSGIERLGKKSLRIVLIEGKNREIRRVFSYFHLHPVKLHRVRIGPVLLGALAEGASRPLALEEREKLAGKGV